MSPLRPKDVLLAPAAALYGLAVTSRAALYRAGLLRTRRLPGRVISVGNVTLGGTGKTPAVIALGKLLAGPGHRLGVLTRGYRRQANELVILNGVGATRSGLAEFVARGGDEPVLLARHLPEVPIAIGADRFAAGIRLAREQGVNLFLLDDGFQHLHLHRDLDIVLLDATVLDDGLLPLGARREPWSALARAHIVIITRVEQADPTPWIRQARSQNSQAAIFCAKIVLDSIREAAADAVMPLEPLRGKPCFAFCGIGNSRAFERNLVDWGLNLAGTETFRDHYRYQPADLERLLRAAGRCQSEFLLTTEKDILNWHLPIPTAMPLRYCRIKLEIDQPERLRAEIDRRLEATAA